MIHARRATTRVASVRRIAARPWPFAGLVLAAAALAAVWLTPAAAQTPVIAPVGGALSGRVIQVVASPLYVFDRNVWLLADGAGVYRSTDGGRAYAASNSGLDDLNVRALAAAPHDSSAGVLLVGTDSGVFRSTDYGATWAAASGLPPGAVHGVVFSPRPDTTPTAYALVRGQGLFASGDHGQTWTRYAAAGLLDKRFLGIAAAKHVDNQVALIAWTPAHVYVSHTWGSIFRDALRESRGETFPTEGEVTWAGFLPTDGTNRNLLVGTRAHGLYGSDSHGRWWTRTLDGVGVVRGLAYSPAYGTDRTVFAATSSGGVMRSTDEGRTWAGVNVGLGFTDVAGVSLSNGFNDDGAVVAVGAEGRAAASSTRGNDWWTPDWQMTAARVLGVGLSGRFAADATLAAVSQQGFHVSSDAGASWERRNAQLPSLDVSAFALSPRYADDGIAIVGIRGRGVFRTPSAGAYWREQNDGLPATLTANPRVFAYSPRLEVDNTVFVGGPGGVFRSRTGGSSWEPSQLRIAPWDEVTALAVADTGGAASTIFAGTRVGAVYRSTDQGDRWTRLFAAPSGQVRALAVSPDYATDTTVVIASASGLFVSSDGGASWSPAGGVTDATAAAFSPAYADDGVIAAASAGPQPRVYLSRDRGAAWSPLGDPLPAAAVTTLVPAPEFDGAGWIFVGTQNAGVFRAVVGPAA